MAYPSGWRPVHGDPGTATVALFDASHRYLGYLNLTPQQGAETLANWARFRPDHDRDEGDRSVATLAAVSDRQLGTESYSCIEDSYTTAIDEKYIEIACIIRGPRSTVVAVGASPPREFSRIAPLLRRAITSVKT
jgi:hypothetical protein